MVMAKTSVLEFVFLILMVTSAPMTEAAVSCNQVVNYLRPCISYVSNGGTLPSNCCNGVRGLYGAAQTTTDRQGVCKCLKSVLNGIRYSPRNLALAAGLPKQCNVNVPYKIDPSTNCDNVK
ncbi:non-specific lipid-transfer protein 1-like [Tripterygium wilfordii]|uniref:Non-specific lipid-transfer protein n=1 Tax=Tripterygium wilfordii TaxID=458696 RepID=A0A7J7DMT7_TRIWF|nr:non-specific lipid-transfer protein 1-like [Tripterygium wilfordii]KAF5747675.1 non-specific lipid-transfer protein 1-like [Tripterygium wilfordii]